MPTSTDNGPRTVSCSQDVFEKRRFEALAQSWMKLASDLEMTNVAAQVTAVKSWRGRTRPSQ